MSELTTADELDYQDGAMLAGRDAAASGTKRALLSGIAGYVRTKLFGSLTGQAGKVPTVNVAEDGFEWGDGGGSAEYPSFAGNEGRFLAVNSTEDDVEWSDVPVPPSTQTAGATVSLSGPFALPADTPSTLSFDTEDFDNGGYFSSGTPTRLTAVATGWYVVTAYVDAVTQNNDLMVATVSRFGSVAGTLTSGFDVGTADVTRIALTSLAYMTAGDQVELGVYSPTTGAELLARFSLASLGNAYPDPTGKIGWYLRVNADGSAAEWEPAASIEGVPEAPVDGAFYARKDAGWETLPSRYASTETLVGTTYDLDAEDVGKYLRFTSATAKTLNVRADATHALPANGEWHIRNVGADNVTVVPAGGVTVTTPFEGTLVVPPGGTITLKRVAVDVLDLVGQTVPA